LVLNLKHNPTRGILSHIIKVFRVLLFGGVVLSTYSATVESRYTLAYVTISPRCKKRKKDQGSIERILKNGVRMQLNHRSHHNFNQSLAACLALRSSGLTSSRTCRSSLLPVLHAADEPKPGPFVDHLNREQRHESDECDELKTFVTVRSVASVARARRTCFLRCLYSL
jgi:hypothetical protein